MISQFLLAAPHSGCGKTVVSAGIMRALAKQGRLVQPFKVGPDYIDPTYHTIASGRPCRNLDGWMLGREAVQESYRRNCAGADVAIVEGVMGLFDGYGTTSVGSTAEIAQWLDLPIVLLLNARGMSRSASAMVHGYATLDPDVKIAGVILNRVGSERHAQLCTEAIEADTGIPVLGYLLRDDRFVLPERHLGLVPMQEDHGLEQVIEAVSQAAEQTINLQKLQTLSIINQPSHLPASSPSLYKNAGRIGIAQDEAFTFTYPENLERLQEMGAELIPFSPLHDSALPEQIDGVMLVGGFPELYAQQLADNRPMMNSIRVASREGVKIYAECGGLMYLTEGIEALDGTFSPMVGLLSGVSRMTKRVTLGYRTVTVLEDSPILPKGSQLRGHEFHYSIWEKADGAAAYEVRPRNNRQSPYSIGFASPTIWASYLHIHFLTNPQIPHQFMQWVVR